MPHLRHLWRTCCSGSNCITKKGKSGKMSVSYNGYTGFSQAARNQIYLMLISTLLMNERYANGYVQSLTILIYLISLLRLRERN
jgi:hypothetical protein